jgi:hypothetical protein
MGRESYLENRLITLIDSVNTSQNNEKEILNILEGNNNISEMDIEMYINNLDNYSEERRSYMTELSGIVSKLEESAEYNAEEYEQQVKILLISEQRLEELKGKIKVIQDDRLNKQKQVRISTYYQKYYRAWSGFMGIFFLIIFINIIFIYLSYKQYIPSIIIPFIVALSIVMLILLSSDLRKRDNQIFDEYNWNFDPNNVKVTTFTSTEPEAATQEETTARTCASTIAASIEESGGTIQCEEGKAYDVNLFKCVITPDDNTSTETTVEPFSNNSEFKSVNIE